MSQLEPIMSQPVVTVDMDDRLSLVKHLFETTDFHHLLVTHRGEVTGSVSDRNLLNALSPTIDTVAETLQDLELLKRKVHQIMNRTVVTLPTDATVAEAAEAILSQRTSCVAVTNHKNRLVGIVTWRDILATLIEHETPQSDDGTEAA